MCIAVDSVPLEARAPGLDMHGPGMHLDLAAIDLAEIEARHLAACSGLARYIAAHCIAARAAPAEVLDPPDRSPTLRACPSTGPAPPRMFQPRAPLRSSTPRQKAFSIIWFS